MNRIIDSQIRANIRKCGPFRHNGRDDIVQTVHLEMILRVGCRYGEFFEKTVSLHERVRQLQEAAGRRDPLELVDESIVDEVISLGQDVLNSVLDSVICIEVTNDPGEIGRHLCQILGTRHLELRSQFHLLKRRVRNLPRSVDGRLLLQAADWWELLRIAGEESLLLDEFMDVNLRRAIGRAIGADRWRDQKRQQRHGPAEVPLAGTGHQANVPRWVEEMVDWALDVDRFLAGLSEVERQILNGYLEGKNDREIAETLCMKPRRVFNTRQKIFKGMRAFYRQTLEQE
ncbi:MAG TPA: hypothetical protein VF590_22095 [Isosphaeraceae bacterium]|jgi:hypothetical protein